MSCLPRALGLNMALNNSGLLCSTTWVEKPNHDEWESTSFNYKLTK